MACTVSAAPTNI